MTESKFGYTVDVPRLRQRDAEALQRAIVKAKDVQGYTGSGVEYDSAVVRAGLALGWVKADDGKALNTDEMWPFEVRWIAGRISDAYQEAFEVPGE